MRKINICIIKPDKYIHSGAFLELGELIYYSLKELGYEVTLRFNNLEPSVKNILLGFHLLNPILNIQQVPKSTIIINTEQIYLDCSSFSKNILIWAKNFEVWDYSEKNIEKFKSLGFFKIKLLRIGFQKELCRLDLSINKDIDVLFYGSINKRRQDVINKIIAAGLKVKTLFGVYGKERDEWIERSHLVLNLHFYNSQIFEIVRLFYLLTNSVAVVSEVNHSTYIDPLYKSCIYSARYELLAAECIEVVKNSNLRERIQVDAFNYFSKYKQKFFTQQLLD